MLFIFVRLLSNHPGMLGLDLLCTLIKYMSATISIKNNPDSDFKIDLDPVYLGSYKTAYIDVCLRTKDKNLK